MERLSCAFATKVIPEGQGVLHTLQTDHITRKPLQVLHYGNINGIDTAYFSRAAVAKDYQQIDRHGLNLEDDDFVFVFVGRIVKDKGINELARCLKKIDCQIILVGSFDDDDPISPEAAEYLKSANHVKWVGWQDDVRPYLALADALVFPSYREGFPNVPIQAGALDLPCIVTDINGCNEIIKDGLNGKIIAAPLSVGHEQMENALYQTMKWFVEHPEEVRRMSRNARSMITSRYEQQDIWRATLLMYQNLGK
jgi:glycosyltransferase involved in cell wall biosynthesis